MRFRNHIAYVRRRFRRLIRYGWGKHIVQEMIASGVPEGLRIPLLYFFRHRLSQHDRSVQLRVEQIRRELAARKDDNIQGFSSPPPLPSKTGAANKPVPGELISCTAADLVSRVSSSPFTGTLLYLVSQYTRARIILELGSAVGISGCYLASGQNCERFITIEGSPSMAAIAKETIEQVSDKGEVYNMMFDEGLDTVLPSLSVDKLDLVWIDGQHEKMATLHYLNRVRPHLHENSLVLFDDIRWSENMFDAWKIIRRYKGFSHAIDLDRRGLCVATEDLACVPTLWDLA